MIRRHGRCPTHERLVDKTPHGHWKTTTFLAALRHDGLTAPLVVEGAINDDIFLAYIRQQLAPTLRSGDLVIMDNLAAHKVAGVRSAIEAAGARLVYLPPYSPDLNPHRASLCQAAPATANRRRTQRGCALATHRTTDEPVQSARMHELPPPLRISLQIFMK